MRVRSGRRSAVETRRCQRMRLVRRAEVATEARAASQGVAQEASQRIANRTSGLGRDSHRSASRRIL